MSMKFASWRNAARTAGILLPLLVPSSLQSQTAPAAQPPATQNAETQNPAAQPEADPRVKASLEQLDIKYQIDEDGDFKVELAIEGDRTQLCYVLSATGSWSSLTFREIWSPVYLFQGTLPAALGERLLRDSGERLVGGWCVTDWDDDHKCLYFTAKTDPELNAKSLHEIMSVVAVVADKFESELTQGKDEF